MEFNFGNFSNFNLDKEDKKREDLFPDLKIAGSPTSYTFKPIEVPKLEEYIPLQDTQSIKDIIKELTKKRQDDSLHFTLQPNLPPRKILVQSKSQRDEHAIVMSVRESQRESNTLDSPHIEMPVDKNARINQIISTKKRAENMEIKEPLKLEDTVLDSFLRTGEIFVVYNERIYTLGNSTENPEFEESIFLKYKNAFFVLQEADDFSELEKIFLSSNQENIEQFKERTLSQMSERNEQLKQEVLNLRSSLDRKFSLSEYIVNKIFSLYNERKPTCKPSGLEVSLDFEEYKDNKVDFHSLNLVNPESYFSGLFSEINSATRSCMNGLIGIFGYLYGFVIKDNLVDLNNFPKSYISLGSLEEFIGKYKERIERALKRKIADSLEDNLAVLRNNEEKVLLAKNQLSQSPMRKNDEGNIGFEQITDNRFVVYRKIPDFIMKRNGNFYHFPAARIGVIIEQSQNKESLRMPNPDGFFNGPGFVFEPGKEYRHPFTRAKNNDYGTELCHGYSKWSTYGEHDVDTQWQKIKDLEKSHFPEQVLIVLTRIEDIMKTGCKGNFAPFIPLTPSNFEKINITEQEARNLAITGVEIYDNN